jgi:RNA polymerase sigma factor (sigma-70 family)
MKHATEPDQTILPPKKSVYQTDIVLWNALRAGCCEAFEQIYQQQFFALYAYGLKITSDQELVKDAIQELFVHIWKKRSKLSETNAIRFYLFTSLKRRIFSVQVKAMKMESFNDFPVIPGLEPENSEEENMIQQQHAAEKQRQVMAAVGALSRREHEAVLYKYYDNLPYQEIAARMAITTPAVYNIISKALIKLSNLIPERGS